MLVSCIVSAAQFPGMEQVCAGWTEREGACNGRGREGEV